MSQALIAMSGGVDSSVAALLTMREGLTCVGCTMRLFDNEDAGVEAGRTCCSLNDAEDARAVAFRLGMEQLLCRGQQRQRRQGTRLASSVYDLRPSADNSGSSRDVSHLTQKVSAVVKEKKRPDGLFSPPGRVFASGAA